jgi:hypothetical protein
LPWQAKTMMFMHISPEVSSYGETVSTLGFGQRVSQVTLGQAKKNQEGAELFAAREAIARLEAGTQGADAQVERLRSEVARERAAAAAAATAAESAQQELRAANRQIAQLQEATAQHVDTEVRRHHSRSTRAAIINPKPFSSSSTVLIIFRRSLLSPF